MSSPPGGGHGIQSFAIREKSALYAAYMPFLKHGGLFIPSTRKYNLGDDVFMLFSLMDEPERIAVAGKVIWITPAGAQGNRAAGIGVEFSEQDKDITRGKIEAYLATTQNSDIPTHTM